MASPLKSRLGRGLGAIITGGAPAKPEKPAAPTSAPAAAPVANPSPANDGGASAPGFRELPVARIRPNPYQPRREFRPEQITELAESIRAEGLLQPVVVRAVEDGFQLIAGERRWRAFQHLKLKSIPARVIAASDASAASMALIENLQRENLNPIEEAQGYASLVRDFDLTQEQVAERVGKGRATIANALRLLLLDAELQGFLGTGLLSTGHAKVLLGVEGRQEQALLARRVVEEGLSVRATEALVANWQRARGTRKVGRRGVPAAEAAAVADIQKRVSSFLNAKVELRHTPKRGQLVIEYRGNDDLQRILEKLGIEG